MPDTIRQWIIRISQESPENIDQFDDFLENLEDKVKKLLINSSSDTLDNFRVYEINQGWTLEDIHQVVDKKIVQCGYEFLTLKYSNSDEERPRDSYVRKFISKNHYLNINISEDKDDQGRFLRVTTTGINRLI